MVTNKFSKDLSVHTSVVAEVKINIYRLLVHSESMLPDNHDTQTCTTRGRINSATQVFSDHLARKTYGYINPAALRSLANLSSS